MSGPRVIAVIGCGNPNRSDDGAGVEVVRALRDREQRRTREQGRAREAVQILDGGTDGMAVMFGARGCTTLIVIDACSTGAEPGAIFEVPGAELAARHEPALSSSLHDFRWEHAVYAGRRIFRDDFPADVVVLLIEGKEFGLGLSLSEEVTAATEKVCARIEQLIAERLPP